MIKKLIFRIVPVLMFLSICFVAVGQTNQPSAYPDRIILNTGSDAETSVAITWRTDIGISEAFCEIQPVSAGPVDKALSKVYPAVTRRVSYTYPDEETVEASQHSCRISGLDPTGRYMYRVGAGDYWSEWFEFRLATSGNDKFTFTYLGDPQNDIRSQWSRIIRSAYRSSPESAFMLYAGDLINRAGRDVEWQEYFEAGSFIFATVPQVMTPGNHDYRQGVLDPHWEYQFSQPENGPAGLRNTCFFIDYKNLKLISIDSAVDSELRDESGTALEAQRAWLDSVLATNTREWVILTTHLPFYSPKESRDNAHLRKQFQPLLEKYGVDLVLTGHDHTYGRGKGTDNPSGKSSIVYVVSVSGPKVYEAGNKEWMTVKGSNIQLFQEISVDRRTLTYKAFTAEGKLFDHFILKKRGNGTSRLIDRRK